MQFNRIITVKKEHSKEEFLRSVLIELARYKNTPADVVKASFGEVVERVREVLICSAHVESDYTASVGYDRTEEYWDKERRTKYVDGKSYEYYEDVKKTRTVTDWHPHSGHVSGDATEAVFNDDENSKYEICKLMNKAIASAKEENFVEEGEADVNLSSLSSAEKECAWSVEFSARLPGDRHKDEKYNSTVDVKGIECCRLPFYEVTFTYDGKKYYACGFACGNVNIYTESPEKDIDIVAQANNDTNGSKRMMIYGWIAFAMLFVFAFIMIIVAKVYWAWVFPLVMLVTAVILHIRSDKVFKIRIKKLKEDYAALKKEELEKALAKYGYNGLTSDESSWFNFEPNNEPYNSRYERKGPKVATIWCSVGTVVLILISLVCGAVDKHKELELLDQKLHSVEQFTLSVTQKSQEYKENVSQFVNSCYYIYLTFQISANEIGADSMQFKVYVYKDGMEIGYIISNLKDMDLDAGATKTYDISFSNRRPENDGDSFFVTMYNAKAQELTYKFEVESIRFSDGKRYSK